MNTGFLSLYYTDCVPGQGTRGGAGFQFQSVSEGVGHDEMSLVQRSTLYEAPVGWMRDQRAVEDYPPSLTHVFDGLYATARGIYLGAEANGVREGNQFTHAVTTKDPDAYGQIRPAQFWSAPWWSERSATTTRCDPIAAEPEHGPWGRDAIREWVLAQPDAEEWLTAVLSAFDRVHDQDARRVVFVGSDVEALVGWIAAGTLLLPQSRALRVTFRILATNPQYSRHHVLAVHPDWAGPYADAGRSREFVVFNLETGRHSDVEPAESARHWVPRFLRQDPYDVVDALEWAHQCAASRGEDETVADRIAGGVVALSEPVEPSSTALFAEWFAAQPEVAVEGVATELAEAAAAAAADSTAWRAVDLAVHRHRLPVDLRIRVRSGLLDAEIRDVLSGTSGGERPRLPQGAWSPEHLRAMTELVHRAASGAPPHLVDPLLRTAARFGLQPEVQAFGNSATRFLTWWLDHPDAVFEPRAWPNAGAMLGRLRDLAQDRFHAGTVSENDVRRTWWRLLHPTITDPADLWEAALAAATVERGGPGLRAQIVRRVLDATEDRDVQWQALFRHVEPTLGELAQLVRQPGRGSEAFERNVHVTLENSARSGITPAHMDVIKTFVDNGGRPPGGHLGRWYEEDLLVRAWLAAPSRKTATALHHLSSAALRPHLLEVLRLLAGMQLKDSARLLESAGPVLVAELAAGMRNWWKTEFQTPQRKIVRASLVFVMALLDECTPEDTAWLQGKLELWIRSVHNADLHAVAELLGAVEARLAADWVEFSGVGKEKKSKRKVVEAGRTVKPAAEPAKPSWRQRMFRRGEE